MAHLKLNYDSLFYALQRNDDKLQVKWLSEKSFKIGRKVITISPRRIYIGVTRFTYNGSIRDLFRQLRKNGINVYIGNYFHHFYYLHP